jgi:aspartate 1-decarboxylase
LAAARCKGGIKKYEKFLLLNIANECGDRTVTQAAFGEKYASVVKRMRAAASMCRW